MSNNLIKNPFFSIIIPVYNAENYIVDCLNSIRNQSIDDYEIILVDDGSTDSSPKILDNVKKNDARIKVYHQENRGQGYSRNYAINAATGKYIMFVDSDDSLEKDALLKLQNIIEGNDVDAVFFNAKTVYESDELKSVSNQDDYYQRTNNYNDYDSGENYLIELSNNGEFRYSAWMICAKRDFILSYSLKFEEGKIYEDAIFCIKLFLMARKMAYLSDVLYSYKVRKNSTIQNGSTSEKKFLGYLTLYRRMRSLADSGEYSPKVNDAIVLLLRDAVESLYGLDDLTMRMNDSIHFESEVDRYTAEELGLLCAEKSLFDKSLYFDGFKRKLEKAGSIIIYGAGKIGEKIYYFLKKNNLDNKIKCFWVSGHSEVQEKMGIQVNPLETVVENVDSTNLVVIAANKKNAEQMTKTLKNKGVENFINLDKYLMCEINREIEE